jgi:phosphonate transport system substrate-binding protein
MIRRAALAVAASALLLASCGRPAANGGGARGELVFSILSAEDQANFGPLWAPLLDDLGRAIGMKVTARFSPTYTSLVEGMRANQVQAGWYSAEPALEATERADAQVFARTVDLQGHDTYTSVIITRAGSGVTLDGVLACGKRLTFGMGDVKSTSGTLAPMTYLFGPRHIDPSACFKTVRTGSHQANLFAVANGLLDASTNNSVGLDFARVGDAPAQAAYRKLKVVWTSPPLPESAIVYRRDLPDEVKRRMADFFTHYGQAPGAEGARQRRVMSALHYTAFHPADDGYLQPVRDMRAAQPAS